MRQPFHLSIVRILIRRRHFMLCLAGVLALIASFAARNVVLERKIESMFSEQDPLLPPYEQLKRVFGGNDIVVAVYDDPELFDSSGVGMERLETIRTQLAAVPGVKGVLSIDLPLGDRILDETTAVPHQIRKLFEGYTHSTDHKLAAVGCMLYPLEEVDIPRAVTINAIREVMEHPPAGIQGGMVTGEPVMIHDAFDYVEADGRLLLTVTTLLLSVAILALFRSFRWMVICVLVVQFALLLTNGIIGAMNLRLTMVGSMLTAVVTVTGIATVVHIVVRFYEMCDTGLDPVRAFRVTANRLVVPIFWACVTDAVGFGALMFAQVGPVADFGLMMAIGSLMVMVSVALLVPGLALLRCGEHESHRIWGQAFTQRHLVNLVELVFRHPKALGLLTLAATVVMIAGIGRLEIESDFTRNFRESTPIVQSYELVESRMGGAGVCDVILPAPDSLHWDYLLRVLKLEHRLRTEVVVHEAGEAQPGLTKVLSLADAVVGGAPRDLFRVRMDSLRESMISTGLGTMRERIPDFYDALTGTDPENPGQNYFRVMLRAKERQPSKQKEEIIQQVRQIAQEEFPEAKVTGYFVLLTSLIESMLRDQWVTFTIALVGILLTMVIAFRSLRLALIATAPNVLPILMVNGAMGWVGLPVNMGAAMIAAVSLGLSIDGSIHYLLGYQRLRRQGQSRDEALRTIHGSVGLAMILSSVALVLGFTSLAVSRFVPTVYFGTLVSISMLGSLFGNLLWLPLLLQLFDHQGQPSPRSRDRHNPDMLQEASRAAASLGPAAE